MAFDLDIGFASRAGRKPPNEDFVGAMLPRPGHEALGAIAAVADGVSEGGLGGEAAQTTVTTLVHDYYAMPETWETTVALDRLIGAQNAWLASMNRRRQPALGMTTLTALVLRGQSWSIAHAGDSRAWLWRDGELAQLTSDHVVDHRDFSHRLVRAVGADERLVVDYLQGDARLGDVFVLTTDGVHEHIRPRDMATAIAEADDLDRAARTIVDAALAAGSPDNLTIQIVRVESVPDGDPLDVLGDAEGLDPAPLLDPPAEFDGYRLLRTLHSGPRSRVYLAEDLDGGAQVALKVLSHDLRDDPAQRRRFVMEEWIARRIDHPHVLKAHPQTRRRSHLYTVMRYVEGQTLTQWMRDHAAPDLETVRRLVEQVARGVQAFHRREMVHQDLRPDNVLIDASGTVQIIDFGATKVLGVVEGDPRIDGAEILGTVQYTAPECFLGEPSTAGSDVFSVGVLTYQMLTGRLPYGDAVPRALTRAAQRRLRYRSALAQRPLLPVWIDGALRKAVHPNPRRRYQALSEFVHDLRHPNPVFSEARRAALLERDPLLFWRLLSLGLFIVALTLAGVLIAQKTR